MRPTTVGELVGRHLTRFAHRVEHRDRVREPVRELLHRGRAGLLQVVRTHVDRIPGNGAFLTV